MCVYENSLKSYFLALAYASEQMFILCVAFAIATLPQNA